MWDKRVGWIYGSVTDVVTGYRVHNRGWRSIYCVTKRDAFRATGPITLLTVNSIKYFDGQPEIKWSGITLHDWGRNKPFWLIRGTSALPAAVLQGLLKVIAGDDISFTLTSKSATPDDAEDEFADLYVVKWSFLMVPPTIMMVNMIAIAVRSARTLYCPFPQWSKLLGGVFFCFWVLCHIYAFAKGLMGRRGRVPTIIYVWPGLLLIIISLLWIYVSPPSGSQAYMKFDFP